MFSKMAWIGPLAMLLASAAPAQAQYPRVELSGWGGYTYSDGVSADLELPGDGNGYARLDPRDSVSFGASFGVYLSENFEIGVLWSRQDTHLEGGGEEVVEISPLQIDNYHGFFTYNFREDDAAVRPYFLGGLGVTRYSGLTVDRPGGLDPLQVSSESRFSTTWGAGLKLYPARNFGFVLGARWTPTLVNDETSGWWCDTEWGCWVTDQAQYSNQWELSGGLTLRF